MRLVDADLLKPIGIRYARKTKNSDGYVQVVLMRDIKNAPTVDAVSVVRCKDCKHRHESEFCECRDDNAFCSEGERMEQD